MNNAIRTVSSNPRLILIMRLLLGGIFIAASLSKVTHIDQFTQAVTSYGILPDSLAHLYGLLVPWIELAIGSLLILGLFSRMAAAISIALTFSFIVANIYGLIRGTEDSCGCFGQVIPLDHSQSLGLDVLMLLMAVPLILRKSLMWSVGACLSHSGSAYVRARRTSYGVAGKTAMLVTVLLVLASFVPQAAQAAEPVGQSASDSELPIGVQIDGSLQSGRPVFVYFYADWCSVCQKQKPVVEEVQAQYAGDVDFLWVNEKDNETALQEFDVAGFPAMFLVTAKVDNDYRYERFAGYTDKALLTDELNKALERPDVYSSGQEQTTDGGAQAGCTGLGCGDAKATADLNTGSTLTEEIDANLADGSLVFVFFYADWCGYSQKQKPIVEELQAQYAGDVDFLWANEKDHQTDLQGFGVTGFPTMFLVTGEVGGKYQGDRFSGYKDKAVLTAGLSAAIGETRGEVAGAISSLSLGPDYAEANQLAGAEQSSSNCASAWTIDACSAGCDAAFWTCDAGCDTLQAGCDAAFWTCDAGCDTCQAGCDAAFWTCDAGCDTCQAGCDAAFWTCDAGCDACGVGETICKAGIDVICYTTLGWCKDWLCGSEFDSCINGGYSACEWDCQTCQSACDSARASCNSACNDCQSTCDNARADCDAACDGCQSTCDSERANCNSVSADCQSTCDSERANCEAVCESFEPCQGVGEWCQPVTGLPGSCADGLSCFMTFGLDIFDNQVFTCFPSETDEMVSDEVCLTFYSKDLHQAAIDLGTVMTYSAAAGGAAGVATTDELGVFYAPDGRYGCFMTACTGLETDLNVSSAACVGLYLSPEHLQGQSIVSVEEVSLGAFYATSQVWSIADALIGTENCFGLETPSPEDVVIPADAGLYSCSTIIDTVGQRSSDGTLYAISAEPGNMAPLVGAGPDATIYEGDTFTSSGSFMDPDSETWTATVDYGDGSGVQALALNPDKTFGLSHAYATEGSYTVTVTVTDGDGAIGSDTALVTVLPEGENSAPTVDAGPDATIDEGDTFASSGSFMDPDSETWTATVDYGDGSGEQSLALNPDKTFDLNHTYAGDGAYTVTVTVTDGDGASGTDTTTCEVSPPPNSPPVTEDDAYATDEDTALSVAAPGVLGNDSDADGDPLTAVLDTGTSNGTLTLNPDGSFDFVPDPDFNGTDGFTYVANDGEDDSEAATVTITVDPVNDPPVAEDDAYATDEDTALNVTPPGVLGNDSDADGDPLTAVLDTGTSSGTLTLNPDGSFDYVPGLDFDGTDGFTYVANDGEDDSEAAAVTITVDPVNDAPVASISAIADATLRLHVTVKVTPQTLNLGRMGNWVKVHIHDDSENNPQQLQVTLNGSDSFDVDGDALTYDWRLTGPHGDVAVEDDVVSQTVALSAGDYTVTLVVNDGTADSATASESFTLTNETIADLSEADPGEFTLNGVPGSEVKGGSSLVVSFDDDAVAATVAVGLGVEMRLDGPVSGTDYIDVIQGHDSGNGKGKSNLK
jgi:thiol-disulfide isomerase/thioredoxin/uncharacterized membrane protein YphA (DoxX/SURF4 family)